MTACLILANGHHKGIQAPLEHGYYMIGRHRECQIRPRSHSVSRRHCLLHHDQEHLRVFDLGSTNTTTVNDEPLEPNEWRVVDDGDKIRCGKVLFEVSFCPESVSATGASDAASQVVSHDGATVGGEPWKEFDVLDFLETEDAKEQQRPYHRLRAEDFVAKEEEENVHVLDDVPVNRADGSMSGIHAVTSVDVTGQGGDATATLRAERIAKIRAKIEQERAKQSKRRGRRFHVVQPNEKSPRRELGPWITYAAALLMCVAIFSLAYAGYQSFVGPEPRVLQDID